MVFWIGILIGGLFVWLAVKLGFYDAWALLFNILIAVYTAVLMTPTAIDMIPTAGDTAYGNALTLMALALATFFILHGISHIFITGQFNINFPKVFDILGAGVIGFLAGLLIWSFAALLISATPAGHKGTLQAIGFGNNIKQTNAPYIEWWCDLVNTITAPKNTRKPTKQTMTWLLKKAEEAANKVPKKQPDPNTPPQISHPNST